LVGTGVLYAFVNIGSNEFEKSSQMGISGSFGLLLFAVCDLI